MPKKKDIKVAISPSSPPLSNLFSAIKNISKDRLAAHTNREDVQIEGTSPSEQVFGTWLSLIVVSDQDVTIIFKAHYMREDSQALINHAFRDKPNELPKVDLAEFMSAFCNLVGGGIKTLLTHFGFKLGISLPMETRGFDEIFFPTGKDEAFSRDTWRLTCGLASIVCSSDIEVHNPEALKAITSEILTIDVSPSQVEFL